MDFSRQEYWSGLPFPSPGDLPNPGIKPGSPTLQADALPSEPPGKPLKCSTWMQSQKQQNDLCSSPRQTFTITVIQVYAPISNAEKAEVEQFCEDLQDLLELTTKKDVLFLIGDWNAKVGSQETPGVTDKFGLGVQNEVGQRLTEFCQENTLVIANTLFQQHKRRLNYTWTSPDGQH